jgi:hypothetical protein
MVGMGQLTAAAKEINLCAACLGLINAFLSVLATLARGLDDND